MTPPPGRRVRVLVVDDEPMIGTSVRRTLAPEHDVIAVQRAEDALERLARGEAFDVILCDLMMPEMNGMELYDELSRASPAHVSRLIFLTGGGFTPRAKAFLDQVPNPRIEKPFDSQHLRTLIQDCLLRGR